MPHREKQVNIPIVLADEPQAARAWIIAESLPKALRAEVIAACKKVGISESVAAAQVQRHRYARAQMKKAHSLPKGVMRMIASAAAAARRNAEVRAD